ncbi:hypothetical protein ACTXIX_18175, partial [Glutamicibacter ardleyensis]
MILEQVFDGFCKLVSFTRITKYPEDSIVRRCILLDDPYGVSHEFPAWSIPLMLTNEDEIYECPVSRS